MAKPAKGKGKGKGAPPPPSKAQAEEHREKAKQDAIRQREQKKKEMEEQQEKEKAFAEAQASFKARLPTLKSHDVFGSVTWSSAKAILYLQGGGEANVGFKLVGMTKCGGILVVELDGEQAICLRCVHEIVEEHFADCIAKALDINVARSRIVRPDENEYADMLAAQRTCRPALGWDVAQYEDPSSTFMQKMKATSPEGWAQMMKYVGSRTSLTVVEFVAGQTLDACDISALRSAPDEVWTTLGRICALDVILNNMDRMPLSVWDQNSGNLGNVMVTAGAVSFVGIDQQVKFIQNEDGCNVYLSRVKDLVQQLGLGSGKMDPSASREVLSNVHAALAKCSISLSESADGALLQGLKAGLLDVAEAWKSGTLQSAISDAETSALDSIVATQSPWEEDAGAWGAPVVGDTRGTQYVASSCANFLRKVATAVNEAISSEEA